MTYSTATGDNEKDKFYAGTNQETIVRVGNNPDNPISVIDGFSLPQYDKITVAYPDTVTETYTYSLNATDVAIITVVYTDASKALLSTVTKSEP